MAKGGTSTDLYEMNVHITGEVPSTVSIPVQTPQELLERLAAAEARVVEAGGVVPARAASATR